MTMTAEFSKATSRRHTNLFRSSRIATAHQTSLYVRRQATCYCEASVITQINFVAGLGDFYLFAGCCRSLIREGCSILL